MRDELHSRFVNPEQLFVGTLRTAEGVALGIHIPYIGIGESPAAYLPGIDVKLKLVAGLARDSGKTALCIGQHVLTAVARNQNGICGVNKLYCLKGGGVARL